MSKITPNGGHHHEIRANQILVLNNLIRKLIVNLRLKDNIILQCVLYAEMRPCIGMVERVIVIFLALRVTAY